MSRGAVVYECMSLHNTRVCPYLLRNKNLTASKRRSVHLEGSHSYIPSSFIILISFFVIVKYTIQYEPVSRSGAIAYCIYFSQSNCRFDILLLFIIKVKQYLQPDLK